VNQAVQYLSKSRHNLQSSWKKYTGCRMELAIHGSSYSLALPQNPLPVLLCIVNIQDALAVGNCNAISPLQDETLHPLADLDNDLL
jgi:hypothetical protein